MTSAKRPRTNEGLSSSTVDPPASAADPPASAAYPPKRPCCFRWPHDELECPNKNTTYGSALIVLHENKILLCKVPSDEPLSGRWELPRSYPKFGESLREVAIKKTLERTNLVVKVVALYALLNISGSLDMLHVYLAKLKKSKIPNFSLDSNFSGFKFFPVDEIPFKDLADTFSLAALRFVVEDKKKEISRSIILS